MKEFRGVYFECATCLAGWELRKGRTQKQIDAFLKRCGYLWIRKDAIAEARRRLKLDQDLKSKSRGKATPKEPQEPSDGGERGTTATGADAPAVLA